MNTPAQKPEMFYLGINKDTGALVEVVAPEKRVPILDPDKYERYNQKSLSDEDMEDVKSALKRLYELIEKSKLKTELSFADVPGQSVCGGSCGGIPFSWCPNR